ncbi:hypothetical protein [Kistimonas scapharcae]|uniref:hypothetical protein n=1 Tax=Kistimonas scapharcae TaxID=1036133 RepID=UPI0031EC169E
MFNFPPPAYNGAIDEEETNLPPPPYEAPEYSAAPPPNYYGRPTRTVLPNFMMPYPSEGLAPAYSETPERVVTLAESDYCCEPLNYIATPLVVIAGTLFGVVYGLISGIVLSLYGVSTVFNFCCLDCDCPIEAYYICCPCWSICTLLTMTVSFTKQLVFPIIQGTIYGGYLFYNYMWNGSEVLIKHPHWYGWPIFNTPHYQRVSGLQHFGNRAHQA